MICYEVHTMFIGSTVSILYYTWGNLDSVYWEYFNISTWIHLRYLFLTVQSRSFAVWRETAASKCLFSLCALSCWELVVMIWLKIFCIISIFALSTGIQVLHRAQLLFFPLCWTPLYCRIVQITAACLFIAFYYHAYILYALCHIRYL